MVATIRRFWFCGDLEQYRALRKRNGRVEMARHKAVIDTYMSDPKECIGARVNYDLLNEDLETSNIRLSIGLWD